jgi:cytochrome P450
LFNRPDYFARLAQLRRDAPVHRAGPSTWVVARHAEVREVSRDVERFCSGGGVLVNDPLRHGDGIAGSILHMDPPAHAAWRQLTSRRFTPRAIAARESAVRARTREVIDALDPDAEIDFVDAVAAPLPVLVIADLLGIEGPDVDQFRRWSDATIDSPDRPGEGAEDMAQLFRFLVDVVRERRAHPRQDLVSLLASATVGGERVSTQAAVGYCLSLLVAGNETTRHLLSGAALALAEHPSQRAELTREPARIPNAVEECLRWVTPIQVFGRTATRPTHLAETPIAEGDFVAMLYASANRDEQAFGPDAGRFDVTRTFTTPHLAFGFGEHLCLGAALARLEARVALEELLGRFPDYGVAGEPNWTRSTLVRGMTALPVVLQP